MTTPRGLAPLVVELMQATLDEAWTQLRNTGIVFIDGGQADRVLLAECLLNVAAEGERDKNLLREKALARLETRLANRSPTSAKRFQNGKA